MVVPGQNTPLGALTAIVPGTDTLKGIVGLSNIIAGKFGIGLKTKPTITGSIVGQDSIINKLGTPVSGIASGYRGG